MPDGYLTVHATGMLGRVQRTRSALDGWETLDDEERAERAVASIAKRARTLAEPRVEAGDAACHSGAAAKLGQAAMAWSTTPCSILRPAPSRAITARPSSTAA
jgi:hypothetical protein